MTYTAAATDRLDVVTYPAINAGTSIVSWKSIFAGAFVAGSLTVMLTVFGSGIGLSSVSPFPGEGASAAGFATATAVWLIIVQWLSSAFGGYLAGRLRTPWSNIHSHEVMFRDTAHGFLAWSVSTMGLALLVSLAVAGGAATGAAIASNNDDNMSMESPFDYYVDNFFRPGASTTPAVSTDATTAAATTTAANGLTDFHAEAANLLALSARDQGITDADKAYLAQLVASHAGISQTEAEARVNDALAKVQDTKAKARDAAEKARKSAAKLAFFTFLSMLIGAFIASVAGAIGGRHRDTHGIMVAERL